MCLSILVYLVTVPSLFPKMERQPVEWKVHGLWSALASHGAPEEILNVLILSSPYLKGIIRLAFRSAAGINSTQCLPGVRRMTKKIDRKAEPTGA